MSKKVRNHKLIIYFLDDNVRTFWSNYTNDLRSLTRMEMLIEKFKDQYRTALIYDKSGQLQSKYLFNQKIV